MSPADEVTRPAASAAGSPFLDRFLVQLGFDRVFIDSVLGDLAEERAEYALTHGTLFARGRNAWEIARSLSYLLATGFVRGNTEVRMRIAGAIAFVLFLSTSAVIAFLSRDGLPATIVLGGGDRAEGMVVNSLQTTQLQTHVLDDRGHRLPTQPVRFEWVSGAPIALSPTGVIRCDANSDAIVRATTRGINASLAVHCRPVRELRTSDWMDFLVGDAPRDLPLIAVGLDGRPVLQLRGMTDVSDTSIAALEGSKLQPRSAGVTDLTVSIGDRRRTMQIIVHQIVASFSALRDDDRHIAIPVRLARGETTRLALPPGTFWLKYLPRKAGDAPPSISVDGGANCAASDGLHTYHVVSDEVVTYCVVQSNRASVTLAHGMSGARVVEGALALDRVDETIRKP
jgi:hypothetical protein